MVSPQSHAKIYPALCLALSDRIEAIDWQDFSPDDWDALPRIAQAEGVAPLLYAKLKVEGSKLGVPPKVMAALAAEYYRTAANNTLLFSELDRILAALDAAGIPVIVLKGAALAQTLYPDPALRPMGDVDLLVKPGDLVACVALAEVLGYAQFFPEAADGLNQHLQHHVHLRQPEGLALEVHWQLLGGEDVRYVTQADWFWEQTLPYAGSAVQLNPLANLIYLAAHAVLQHGGSTERLLWFYDLDLIIHRSAQTVSANPLWEAAGALDLQGALAAALRRCRALFQTPVPDEWLVSIPADLGPLDDLVTARQQKVYTRFALEVRKLQGLSWSGRLRLAWALVFPSPVYMRWRYHPQPAWLWPAYYIYRWADVLGDMIKTVYLAARSAIK